jgi:hypothetical protein
MSLVINGVDMFIIILGVGMSIINNGVYMSPVDICSSSSSLTMDGFTINSVIHEFDRRVAR